MAPTLSLQLPALILHQDPAMRDALGLTLSLQGFSPICSCDVRAQLDQALKDNKGGLAFLEIGGIQGFQPDELLDFQRQHRDAVVIALLDRPDQNLFKECFSQGAFEVLHRPFEAQELWRCLSRLLNQPPRLMQPQRPRLQRGQLPFPVKSPVMKAVLRRARQLALETDVIFIQGETGTPIQELAAFLHQESGRKGPLLALDASHFSTSEQKLRLLGGGHRLGLLQQTQTGSLLLKDYANLSLRLQKAILDHVQKERGPKLILSSPDSPLEMLGADSISPESFSLMQEAMLFLPSLRSCSQDMEAFFDFFVEEACLKLGKTLDLKKTEILQVLRQQPWDRNHDELRETVQRVIQQHKKGPLTAKEFLLEEPTPAEEGARVLTPLQVSSRNLKTVKHLVIQQVMAETNHNQTEAANLLGYTRQALNQYLRKHRMA